MASLADLAELVGFFSYSREDDEDSRGALSALRDRIQRELRGQLGRSMKTFRLWQDKEAIPSGSLWESEIRNAVEQAAFFIPIITPTVVRSPYCRFELESFLAREAALGRNDLVFPILYIRVADLDDAERQKTDPVLSIIAKRQYLDWREFRHRDINSTEVREAIERFCTSVCDALNRRWLSPDERRAQDEAAARARTEEERRRQEADAKRRSDAEAARRAAEEERQKREAEVERNRIAALEAKAREEEDRRRRQAEIEQQRAESKKRTADDRRLRDEAELQRRAEEEEPRRSQPPPFAPARQISRPTLLIGSLAGIVVLGAIGAWFALSPAPVSEPPTAPAPAVPANAPLSATQERALKPGQTFQECANCPVMMVIPAGSFTMGSSASEPGHTSDEGPQHMVTIAQQYAVGQFALTFEQWDACAADGGCNRYRPSDQGWGRARRPVIGMSWDDAKVYAAWLAEKTGRPYRLLSEAEYEYATRAGTTTAYPWGSAVGRNNANCDGCGSQWDGTQTAPVGSFAANGFGLYDTVGNVWQWIEDCWHDDYNGAPADGSAWTSTSCNRRVARGGSWTDIAVILRSAGRRGKPESTKRDRFLGFRVARTLLTP